MSEVKITRSNWYPADQLIITEISGDIEMQDIIRWEETLQEALNQVEDSESLRIFVNLHGFKAANLAAHKYFRSIVPLTLADYGWKVGYVAMFPEQANEMVITRKRNVQCIAAAHCHQDTEKIERYEQLYSSEDEHFFTDPDAALNWISHWRR